MCFNENPDCVMQNLIINTNQQFPRVVEYLRFFHKLLQYQFSTSLRYNIDQNTLIYFELLLMSAMQFAEGRLPCMVEEYVLQSIHCRVCIAENALQSMHCRVCDGLKFQNILKSGPILIPAVSLCLAKVSVCPQSINTVQFNTVPVY